MLKCFVGALIPDEKYSPDIEGSTVDSISKAFDPEEDADHSLKELLDLPNKIDVNDVLYLKHLQELHDSTSPETWVNRIIYLKEIYTQ